MGLHAALLFYIAKGKTSINMVDSEGLRGLLGVAHPGYIAKRDWDKGLFACLFYWDKLQLHVAGD